MDRNQHAARLIKELRVDRGLTPETLSYEIHRRNPAYSVSGRTIRRIEKTGAIPTVRVQFGIAQVFDRLPSDIWAPTGARARVPA